MTSSTASRIALATFHVRGMGGSAVSSIAESSYAGVGAVAWLSLSRKRQHRGHAKAAVDAAMLGTRLGFLGGRYSAVPRSVRADLVIREFAS
jgi:hypothetical protein